MPVEIRELVIKALIAIDCENKTVSQAKENIGCLKLPGEEDIALYVMDYFKIHNTKTLSFDQSGLSAFLIEWQASLLR